MSAHPPPTDEEARPVPHARSRDGLVIGGLAVALVAVIALVVILAVSGDGSAPATPPAAGSATPTDTEASPTPSTPSPAPPDYPAGVVQSFMRSCTAQGTSAAVCQCALDKFEAKYTVEEFEAQGRKLLRGRASKEFTDDLVAFSEECASTEVS